MKDILVGALGYHHGLDFLCIHLSLYSIRKNIRMVKVLYKICAYLIFVHIFI